MPKKGRRDQPSSSTWPWWKAAAIALFTLGGFGAVLTVIPPYSSSAMKVAIGLTLVGTVGAVWGISKANWWGGIVLLNSWFLLILGFAIRAWALVIPQVWIWLMPLVAAYLLAWALPAISPKLSARLLREQFAPETRWGRGCLTLFLVVGPAAGALGAGGGVGLGKAGRGAARRFRRAGRNSMSLTQFGLMVAAGTLAAYLGMLIARYLRRRRSQ